MANNYTALIQDIKDFTENDATEFTDNIALIIDLAELRLGKDLDVKGFNGSGTTTVSTKAVAIPTTDAVGDAVTVISINFVRSTPSASGGVQVTLQQKEQDFIETYWPNAAATGTPRFYALTDNANIIVAPTPSSSTAFLFDFTLRLDPLVASSNETNYLTDHYYDALLYTCLIVSAGFMKEEPQEFSVWNTMYQEAILRGREEEKRIKADRNRRRN